MTTPSLRQRASEATAGPEPAKEQSEPPEGWEYDSHYDEELDDDLDLYEDECGMTNEGLCMYAGSEWCDWDCPLEKAHRRSLAKDPAP